MYAYPAARACGAFPWPTIALLLREQCGAPNEQLASIRRHQCCHSACGSQPSPQCTPFDLPSNLERPDGGQNFGQAFHAFVIVLGEVTTAKCQDGNFGKEERFLAGKSCLGFYNRDVNVKVLEFRTVRRWGTELPSCVVKVVQPLRYCGHSRASWRGRRGRARGRREHQRRVEVRDEHGCSVVRWWITARYTVVTVDMEVKLDEEDVDVNDGGRWPVVGVLWEAMDVERKCEARAVRRR